MATDYFSKKRNSRDEIAPTHSFNIGQKAMFAPGAASGRSRSRQSMSPTSNRNTNEGIGATHSSTQLQSLEAPLPPLDLRSQPSQHSEIDNHASLSLRDLSHSSQPPAGTLDLSLPLV